jgi:hypothetical protein
LACTIFFAKARSSPAWSSSLARMKASFPATQDGKQVQIAVDYKGS